MIIDRLVITKGPGLGSRVELFAAIRRGARVEGLSIRELAAKHHVHRRTVRQGLASAVRPRKTPGFPRGKRIEEVDFEANSSVSPAVILQPAGQKR